LFSNMSRGLTLLFLGIVTMLRDPIVAANLERATASEPRRLSEEEARAVAVYAPKPPYPHEARAKGMTGYGFALLEVDPSRGSVTSARLLQSTGHLVLDDAALTTFRRWRFKPGTVSKVRIPIRFTLGRFNVYVRAVGDSSWLRDATHWFLPDYPYEADIRGITGSGVAMLKIDPRSGYVTSASMLKSTGQEILDDAALRAFREWRFEPRTLTIVKIPIEFTSSTAHPKF